ncbi:MAG: hypothetical protein ACUVWZ_08120, partial [Anaerolineae bacterium]
DMFFRPLKFRLPHDETLLTSFSSGLWIRQSTKPRHFTSKEYLWQIQEALLPSSPHQDPL